MRYVLFVLAILCPLFHAGAQALRDINYRYMYNPEEPFRLHMNTVKGTQENVTFFKLDIQDSLTSPDDLTIEWQLRESLSDKEGKGIPVTGMEKKRHAITGHVSYPVPTSTVLVAKVTSVSKKRAWFFHQMFNSDYPVPELLKPQNEVAQYRSFVQLHQRYGVNSGGSTRTVSFYSQDFPAAVPPFAESQGRVSKVMKPDSVFQVQPGQSLTFSKTGLYLMQQDTTSKDGLAFRVEDDYPRLGKIESLADPLIYICTKDEFIKLKQAKGDKKAFDKVVLSITNDKDRARNLFRSYFRRVEIANEYFTSYKEGWKTDRGMIYIIFGVPDEVYRFTDREVWNYKNEEFKASFNFVKSSTIFDPDNYVLVREKGIRETWYTVIDLWRNARF